MIDDHDIHLIADCYRDAVLASAEMLSAARSLELIRATMDSEPDHYKIWDVICQQIGLTDDTKFRQALMGFRDRFVQQVCKQEAARLRSTFKKNREKGWAEWLTTYVQALWVGKDRVRICQALCSTHFEFPKHVGEDVERIQRLTQYVLQDRWDDAYDSLIFLTEQPMLPGVLRAEMSINAALVELYFFSNKEKARKRIERAEELAPGDGAVSWGWASYWVELADYEKARKFAQEAINRDPSLTNSYETMGDCFEKQADVDAAEDWYREAIKVDAGDASAYIRLMRLYGRSTEMLVKYELQLQSLVEKAIAVSPPGELSVYIEMGAIYRQNHRYKEAYNWFEKTIKQDSAYLNGYLMVGEAALEPEQKDYKRAEEAFLRASNVAPEAFLSYWGMGVLKEQQERWEEAIHWYELSLPRRPVWEGIIRARLGDLKWKLHRYQEAEEEMLKALRFDPANDDPLNRLELWADEYFKAQKNAAAALSIYERIREIKGRDYEAAYWNRVGNVNYYNGKYQEAIEAYGKAVAIEPEDPAFLSNLALGWENIKEPGQRLAALEKAIAALRKSIQMKPPEESSYTQRLEKLELEREQVQRAGEFVVQQPVDGEAIIAEIGLDLLAFFADEGMPLPPSIQGQLNAMRERFRKSYGVEIPGIQFKDNLAAKPNSYAFRIAEFPLAAGEMLVGYGFFPADEARMEALGLIGFEAVNPVTGGRGYWIGPWSSQVLENKLELWQEMEYPLRHLEAALQKNLVDLVDHRQVVFLLESKNAQSYALIKDQPEKITALTQALQSLIKEGVSITAIDELCSEFVKLWDAGTNPMTIVEKLCSLPAILPQLPGNTDQYSFVQVGALLESKLQGALQRNRYQPVLKMTSQQYREALHEIREKVASQENVALLVEDATLRPFVKKLIEAELPKIPVLSYAQLLPELQEKAPGMTVQAE